MPSITLTDQVERLISLGVPQLADLDPQRFAGLAEGLPERPAESDVLVIHPSLVPASRLSPLLSLDGKPGFVVPDMIDLDEFTDIDGLDVPDRPLYLITGVDRGDAYRNRTPRRPCRRSARPAVRRSPSARGSAGCCSARTCWSRTTAS